MNTAKKSLVLAVVMFMGLVGDAAAEEKTAEAKMELKQVSLFKNGLGFFVREGEAKLDDGWAVSEVVPPAALGDGHRACHENAANGDTVASLQSGCLPPRPPPAQATRGARRCRPDARREVTGSWPNL